MTFAKRKINVRFILDASQGSFQESGTNAVDLTGLRCEMSLVNTMGNAMNQLDMTIYGMTQSLMNKLTVLQNGWVMGIYNQIEVTVGQDNDLALIFVGHISQGWADYSQAPEVGFVVQAYGGGASLFVAPAALSYKGSISAANVAMAIAASMVPPHTLENDGVDVQLTDVNLPSDPMTQLKQLARMAHFNWTTDDANAVLAIWPIGQTRQSSEVDIKPETGLVGYPSFNDKGIVFSSLFNPNIRVGSNVNITSSVQPANGKWAPFNVQHDLQSEVEEARWFTHVQAQHFINEGQQTA